jgi:hypothetical protein
MLDELGWFPINTDRAANGALVSLASFPNGSQLLPIPLFPGQRHFNRFEDESDTTSLQVAASLGVGSIGDLKTGADITQFIYHYLWYEEVSLVGSNTPPVGGILWGTKWGAGLRITVRVQTSQSQLNLTLAELGTRVELGTLSASFETETFGIAAGSYIAKLPRPGRLDNATVKVLLSAADEIKNAGAAIKATWTPLPFRVQLPRSVFSNQVYGALSTAFAARQIRNGTSYAQAVAKAKAHPHASWLAVHHLYESLALSLDDKAVPEAQRHVADLYL